MWEPRDFVKRKVYIFISIYYIKISYSKPFLTANLEISKYRLFISVSNSKVRISILYISLFIFLSVPYLVVIQIYPEKQQMFCMTTQKLWPCLLCFMFFLGRLMQREFSHYNPHKSQAWQTRFYIKPMAGTNSQKFS